MATLRHGLAFLTMTLVVGASASLSAAGCSSSSGGGGDAPADSGPETGKPPVPPPDVGDDTTDAEAGPQCPPADLTPVTAADLDKQISYKAAVVSTACTTAEMTTFDTNSKATTNTSFNDLGKNLSDACKACVIAKDTDPHWAPIVATAADNGATGFYDFGACFGAVEGDACGKAIQYSEFCFNIACNKCANGNASARTACVKKAGAKGGFCETFEATVQTACPNIAQTQNICANIVDAATFLCTGTVDAGHD